MTHSLLTICLLFIAVAILSGNLTNAATVEVSGTANPELELAQTTATGYLENLYAWMLGIVGLASLFALVYGGVLYILSGTITSTEEAKRWMTNAIYGLLLAALSWVILYTINPELVKKFDIKTIIEKNRTP